MNNYVLIDKRVIEEPNIMAWASWFESADRTIERTDIAPEITVSTVFLGVDHQYGDGPPLVFETMIFGGDRDQDCWRYSTYAQAVEGHKDVVAKFSKEKNEQIS